MKYFLRESNQRFVNFIQIFKKFFSLNLKPFLFWVTYVIQLYLLIEVIFTFYQWVKNYINDTQLIVSLLYIYCP